MLIPVWAPSPVSGLKKWNLSPPLHPSRTRFSSNLKPQKSHQLTGSAVTWGLRIPWKRREQEPKWVSCTQWVSVGCPYLSVPLPVVPCAIKPWWPFVTALLTTGLRGQEKPAEPLHTLTLEQLSWAASNRWHVVGWVWRECACWLFGMGCSTLISGGARVDTEAMRQPTK